MKKGTLNRCQLTWWKPAQRTLDIQQHLVVVLVILPVHFFWKEQNWHQRGNICVHSRWGHLRELRRASIRVCGSACTAGTSTRLLIQDVKGDVEQPGPDLAAYLVGEQPPFADSHPPQSCNINWARAEGLRDVIHFLSPPAVPAWNTREHRDHVARVHLYVTGDGQVTSANKPYNCAATTK